MPGPSTLEAHFKATRLARTRLVSPATLLDIAQTRRGRAPAKFGIKVDDDILMKAQVLGIDLLRTKLAYVLT